MTKGPPYQGSVTMWWLPRKPEGIAPTEISQRQRTNTVRVHLHEGPNAVKFIETESRTGVPGPEGRGRGQAAVRRACSLGFARRRRPVARD